MAKRPYIPLKAKLDACLILLGLDPKDIEWHHDPPLAMRLQEIWKGLTIYNPEANDPRYLRPISKAAHKLQTFGTGKPRDGDIKTIAHVRRATKKEAEFRSRLLAALGDHSGERKGQGKFPKRKFPKRPFPKRNG